MLTQKVLARMGLGDVEMLDRRNSRQKSRLGGCELLCRGDLGGFPMRVVVKVIGDAIRVRMLSELAGTVDRLDADLGVIVSPHYVTAAAAKQQSRYRKSRIEIIDGLALSRLLRKFNIGVRTNGEADFAFFQGLEDISPRVLDFIQRETKIL